MLLKLMELNTKAKKLEVEVILLVLVFMLIKL